MTNHRRRERWYTCGRCGNDYPESRVLVQRGLIVCQGIGTNHCHDQRGYAAERRRLRLPLERPNTQLPIDSGDL